MTPLKRGSCVRPASLFKMQVELCFFDTGSLTNCNDGQKGTGWNLKRAAEDAARFLLPQDDAVFRCDCDGKPSAKLPNVNPVKVALHGILQKLGL